MAEKQAPPQPNIKHLVRIANTDMDGKKQVLYALSKIKGIGIMYANAVCRVAKIDPRAIIGALSDEQVKHIATVISQPSQHGLPPWMFNRRYDRETGADGHLLGTDLSLAVDNDIKIMKKIKCWKGVRHSLGQPVRGQRTRSNTRRNKGKVQLGVTSSKAAPKEEGKK